MDYLHLDFLASSTAVLISHLFCIFYHLSCLWAFDPVFSREKSFFLFLTPVHILPSHRHAHNSIYRNVSSLSFSSQLIHPPLRTFSNLSQCLCLLYSMISGFLGASVVKNPPASAGDTGSIPGSGRSPGEGNGNPLHCSCLENPVDRGAWWASVYGLQKSRTWLSN